MVLDASREEWRAPEFQRMLWDASDVSGIGPGQAVTVVEAYSDTQLADLLFDARGSLDGLGVEQRGERLQMFFEEVLAWIYPRYTKRRPKARLVRLLASMFPHDMSCLMDAGRVFGVQRALGAPRLPGSYVAQHSSLRERVREAVGAAATIEEAVDQSIFCWFLWQTKVDRADDGAVALPPPQREANALPALSLLPANAQRRALAAVKDNVNLLVAMVREAEQGIAREDLIDVILNEAPQLNASSAPNMISQAMGGLGLIRLEDGSYRPTERGQELLIASDPVQVLRGPLVGRVFGMGHLLLMIGREPGALRHSEAARRLQDLVPTWTSTLPGSHIVSWARLAGLVQLDGSAGGGRLVLTEDGDDYAAALPMDFERLWRLMPEQDVVVDAIPDEDPVGLPVQPATPAPPYDAQSILNEGCFLGKDRIEAAVELLRRKKNIIIQGPPGTGKTWLAKRLGYALIGAKDTERLVALQFQPSLSYEDFVRGWRPDGRGGLRLVDGAFLEAVQAAAAKPRRPFVLVIEEVNRGNPAQILGELLTLVEATKRGPDEALRLAYPRSLDERVYVPENLYIVGTMNLADRSLALIDLALRRRFAFLTLMPELGSLWRAWCVDRGVPSALVSEIGARMNALNAAIAEDRALGPQFQVGHSFVTPASDDALTEDGWRRWYQVTIDTEVAPLLAEYWFDEPNKAHERTTALRLTA
ncbi:McrB family protein [Hansschlegelia beijingensis]|uniref:5-methylcytosine-specific restriction protein B n=1 Tax=Hansschlegelia beijingensis TaxID=1133344 RepID=A0A7W6GEZ4_9HYPH|nr:AAA family ATPase [Hansschlegelia beijingensis]MBB3973366.1 5-methylcytosine-specific restriction protein B [Hansschlegelia beijingensis]